MIDIQEEIYFPLYIYRTMCSANAEQRENRQVFEMLFGRWQIANAEQRENRQVFEMLFGRWQIANAEQRENRQVFEMLFIYDFPHVRKEPKHVHH